MIYDYTTKNISFIKIHKELKDLGIKENKFFLILYDIKLQGVDPHLNTLSADLKYRIQKEIRINYFYFIREVVKIPVPGGVSSYELNRGNLAQSYAILNNLNAIEVLPRQHGKTIGAVVAYVWIYNYATINTNLIFSNKQLDDSQLNIKRFNDITLLLPDYLRTHLNTKTDTDNLNLIACSMTNNSIKALSTARDISSADERIELCRL